MTKQIHSFDIFQIQFDSGQIPPPFCHRYQLSISRISSGDYTADFNLEYYDRNEITEEEIYEEGFSLEDDFQWNGNFPAIWIEAIIDKLNGSNWKKKASSVGYHSRLVVKITHEGIAEIRFPSVTRIWEQFAQELIQVIFETSKREAPLKIDFASKLSKNQTDRAAISYRFADRIIQISSNKRQSETISWTEGQKLLKHIFSLDYLPEKGLPKIPKKQGFYISPGDGLWYDIAADDHRDTELTKEDKLVKELSNYVK